MPIGPLMKEHRLIEKMIKIIVEKIEDFKATSKIDVSFIHKSVDFIRIYADKTHHGKEEDILFRDLKKKKLTSDHEKRMYELIEDHVFARKKVGQLVQKLNSYDKGNPALFDGIIDILTEIVRFYPDHIEREDKGFFIPIMGYFSKQEQEKMLDEFWEFDKSVIHFKYEQLVKEFENP